MTTKAANAAHKRILKSRPTAKFVTIQQALGNVWSGYLTVRPDMTIQELRDWIEGEQDELTEALEMLESLPDDAKLSDPDPES